MKFIPLADHNRVIAQLDVTDARLAACVDALAAVMRTLRQSAGSPAENEVYARAREVLAENGIGAAEAAEYQAAYAEWEGRRR